MDSPLRNSLQLFLILDLAYTQNWHAVHKRAWGRYEACGCGLRSHGLDPDFL